LQENGGILPYIYKKKKKTVARKRDMQQEG
jgi:hypothetical protein